MVKDSGKWYPLHSALIFADLATAKDLIHRGDDRDMLARATPDKGWRAIHFACHSGSNEAVSYPVSSWSSSCSNPQQPYLCV